MTGIKFLKKDILYIAAGPEGSTSILRARALERLGHSVHRVNACEVVPRSIWLQRFHKFCGFGLLQRSVQRHIMAAISDRRYDIGWVDSGYLVGGPILRDLRNKCKQLVNYCHDDPPGGRDGNSWISYRTGVSQYDFVITVRECTRQNLIAWGAKRVLREYMSYDDAQHVPIEMTPNERAQWSSEVLFIGTWMPERGPIIKKLLDRGVPLKIFGDRWDRCLDRSIRRNIWMGRAVYGREYCLAVSGAKLCLGLLSKGNRDQHTTRSFEIPAIGSVLVAERTDEHMQIFRDGIDAALWADETECATKCLKLLSNEKHRNEMALSGQQRVRHLRLSNTEAMARILHQIR